MQIALSDQKNGTIIFAGVTGEMGRIWVGKGASSGGSIDLDFSDDALYAPHTPSIWCTCSRMPSKTSAVRHELAFEIILQIVESDYKFEGKAAHSFFNRHTCVFKDWNYLAEGTDHYRKHLERIEALRAEFALSTRKQLLGVER